MGGYLRLLEVIGGYLRLLEVIWGAFPPTSGAYRQKNTVDGFEVSVNMTLTNLSVYMTLNILLYSNITD